MAKAKKGGKGGERNDARPNGKAWKKSKRGSEGKKA